MPAGLCARAARGEARTPRVVCLRAAPWAGDRACAVASAGLSEVRQRVLAMWIMRHATVPRWSAWMTPAEPEPAEQKREADGTDRC